MDQAAQTAVAAAKATFRLWLNDDKTAVLADCNGRFRDMEQVVATLRESLEALGIDDPIGKSAAEHAFRAAIERGPLEAAVLLESRHPTETRDEQMAWAREYFAQGYYLDPETGAIDYRRRAAETSVSEGEKLGTVEPGQPGEPGLDLFGATVPARPVERVKVRAGKGVRYEEEERAFYAEVSGQVRLMGNVLSVDAVVTVPGSVGLQTGNIRHPGALLVEENIEAGSEVVAAGNVEVKGYIEDAVVSAGGLIIVHGGITGSRTVVKARGEVHAKFILNARVEAEGDIHVEREIDNAHIFTRGRLTMPNGRFVGGECMALGGVTLKEAGSDSGHPTRLAAGEDFALKRKLALKQERIEHLQKTLADIRIKIDPIMHRMDRLTAHAQQNLSVLLTKIAEGECKVQTLEREMKELREASKAQACNEVIIQKRLHSDTVFRVAGMLLRNDRDVSGPIKVAVTNGELHLMAVTRR